MDVADCIRDFLIVLARIVNDHGKEKRLSWTDEVRSVDRQFPLQPEISFSALMRVAGNQGYEQGARPDLSANGLIPRLAAPQLALVEPDLDTGAAQCIANSLRRPCVL